MRPGLSDSFVHATVNVLKTMASCEPHVGEPCEKEGCLTWGDVTGIIGLAGEQANGNMALSFSRACILKIVSNMLFEEFSEIDEQVLDAVGEITNIVTGGAKKELGEAGYCFSMAQPMIIVGKDIEVRQLAKTPVVAVPFSVDGESFFLETAFVQNG